MNFQSLTLVNVTIKNHFPWKQTKEAILFKNLTVFLTVQIDQQHRSDSWFRAKPLSDPDQLVIWKINLRYAQP